MLSEVSQTQKYKYYMISPYVESKLDSVTENRNMVARGYRDGEMGSDGQKVQSFHFSR